ncbi:cysteine hydrolase [Mesorhizobium sp. CN2-181]|uniref:cysteine hydrolase family protein n=1 Tax=Mesorhizobium yinganensis TaxID=3157707 RepID=UPI0032B7032F
MASHGLAHGPLGPNCLHVCVDMQGLFGPGSPWAVPWMQRVLPAIANVCERFGPSNLFTRFIPADQPGAGTGAWARYYTRWAGMTLSEINPDLCNLIPALRRYVPPGRTLDKRVYSPWTEGHLDALLRPSGIDTLVITGGETDVCVLATALGAIDRGYRLILVEDALCSSADDAHDTMMTFYHRRFTEQVEIVEAGEL